jgi:hypothetical protein
MHNATMLVEFDRRSRRQVEDAKSKFIQAKRHGRQVLTVDGQPLQTFSEVHDGFKIVEVELARDHFALRIFDDSGDRRLIWDARDPDQITEATRLFNDYVRRGWKAYAVTPDGTLSHRIRAFDAETQEVHFDDTPTTKKLDDFTKAIPPRAVPTTLRQKLAEFAKSFKEVHLLPKTYPG